MFIHFLMRLPWGNTIRAGIEQDTYGRVAAYHIWEQHPGDTFAKRNKRIRIPANEITHVFDKERSAGNRGAPWTSASLIALTHLKEFSRSIQIAARVASAKMGFFTKTETAGDYKGDSDAEDDEYFINEAVPGSFEVLPHGYNVQSFDPETPPTTLAMFNKEVLKSIAASLNIQYYTLTGDLESASYSSLRSGSIQETAYFKTVQLMLIETVLEPVYSKFLESALLVGKIPFGVGAFDKFEEVEFLPRAFPSVDPSKSMLASKIALDYKLKSKTQVISELGREYENVFNEIADENELLEELGLIAEEVETGTTQEVERVNP